MAWLDHEPSTTEDELDRMMRQAMRGRMARAEPPDALWTKIRDQVAAGPSPRQRPPVRNWSHLLAPLVQGMAAVFVLVLLGFSLTTSFMVQGYQVGSQDQLALAVQAPDTSPLPALVEPEQQPVQPSPTLASTADDVLSRGVLLRYQQEAQAEESARREAILRIGGPAGNPELDPVLIHRRVLVDPS